LLENTHSKAAGHTKTDGFAFTLALTALVRANTDTQGYCPKKARSVTVVVAANVNPLPAIVGRDLSPAGVVCVIVEATTKAERDEIAIVEPIVEMAMVPVLIGARLKTGPLVIGPARLKVLIRPGPAFIAPGPGPPTGPRAALIAPTAPPPPPILA